MHTIAFLWALLVSRSHEKSTFLITTRHQQTQYNYLSVHRLLLAFLYGMQQSTFKFFLFQWPEIQMMQSWLTFRYSKSPVHDVHKHGEQSHGTFGVTHPVYQSCQWHSSLFLKQKFGRPFPIVLRNNYANQMLDLWIFNKNNRNKTTKHAQTLKRPPPFWRGLITPNLLHTSCLLNPIW